MKYTDLIENYGFTRNMQETNWLKLFPHWWSENDPLLETIGKEVAFLKAQGIFTLLNTMVKPPVLIWQNSVVEKEYVISDTFTDFDKAIITNQAPLYKTFGHIDFVSYSDEDIHNLKIAFTDNDYIIIKNIIKPQDELTINVGEQTVTINGKKAIVQAFGDGISYFKTQKQTDMQNWNPQEHYFSNEELRISFTSDSNYDIVNFDVNVVLNNVVFINEQNIEITGLELVPIKNMELYIYYDFPYNQKVNGWQKASEKKYIEDTNVIYDMITTKFPVKKFYVDVWYKGLDYPYRVGFPAQKNADDESIYHVNKELDTWGEYFGLKRRFYKENIPEKDYPYTYPEYYPFDIEQDYWYYQRMINEYVYTEWAINDVDLLDTDGTPVIRLHAIDPFVEDLVIHAKSVYPENENGIKTKKFMPTVVSQELLHDEDSEYRRSEYRDIHNLLKDDDNKAFITLRNKIGAGITYQQYLSKALKVFFDLKDIEKDVHINDLQILVEAESTDNKDNKYSNQDTGIIIHGISDDHIFPLKQDSIYELEEKEIAYNLSISMDDIRSYITNVDTNIVHEATIGAFEGVGNQYVNIPFTLKENDEIIHDITDVYVIFDKYQTVVAEYYDEGYIRVLVPNKFVPYFDSISIACKTEDHDSFVANNIPIKTTIEDVNTFALEEDFTVSDEWHTNDLRNILQKDGISFVNVFQNDDETNIPTILIKNIKLKVSYSHKQTDFDLNTQVLYQATKPAIAQLKIEIVNTGDKDLNTVVDVVSATNLTLQPKQCFTVDLKIGDKHTEYIDIIPEYPLIDGQYDVLTVCNDKTRVNTVLISGEGLLQTTVDFKDHYGILGNDVTLTAKVSNINKQNIENGQISFYIDDYYIGTTNVLTNNVGTITIPSTNRNLSSGLHRIEARFSGTAKYQSSRSYAYLSMLRTDIIMDIDQIPNGDIINGRSFDGIVKFYIDNNGEQTPLIPGENENNKVSFYLDDLDLGSATIGVDGQVHFVSDIIDVEPGTYTLMVNYHGNGHYVQQQKTKEVNVIGGKTNTIVLDVTAKPTSTTSLEARVVDSLKHPLKTGTVTFKIDDIIIGDAIVKNGIAKMDYTVPNEEQSYIITATYNDEIYQTSEGQGTLRVKKGTVIIDNPSIFYASQYEPLGFYFNVTDLDTNEKVKTGKITVDIPALGLTCEGNVESDGGVRILYNVVNFSSKDLREIEKFNFSVTYDDLIDMLNSDQTLRYTREDFDADNDTEAENNLPLMNFYRNINDKEAHLIFEYKNTSITTVDENNIVVDELPPGFEQVYIKNGHLFVRTNIDTLRQYLVGRFPITITYSSDELYNTAVKSGNLLLQQQDVNIDLMSYDLTYNEKNESLTCYVSTYNINDDNYQPINQGGVQFYVDDIMIGQANVVNGQAILSPSYLKNIEQGNHLLQTVYIPVEGRNNTYTYTSLQLHKIVPTIHASFVTQLKGRKNQLNVSICIDSEYDMSIDGDVEVYLNDTKIANDYLFGIETSPAWIEETDADTSTINNCSTLTFMVDIPDDADINDYQVTVKYLGNQYIEEKEKTIDVVHQKINTYMTVNDIKVAHNEMCTLDVIIDTELHDFINEGEVVIKYGTETLARSNIKNNKAILNWINTQTLETVTYNVYYQNATHYQNCDNVVTISSVDPLDHIYIKQENVSDDIEFDETDKEVMTDINEALQCLAENGTLHIVNQAILSDNIYINKNINIVGHNDATLIKDIGDLLTESSNNIKVYNYDEFEEIIYEIIGLSLTHINDRDFCIIDNDLYYISSTNDFVPIFLLDDGKFYSYNLMPLASVVQSVSIFVADVNVTMNNIIFKTDDATELDDFVINNRGNLDIQQCVLNKYVRIINYKNANINCNLVYGDIDNYGTMNKDNNWWGSNTINDNSINNHIILTLWANKNPPVVGEDIEIYGQLIGANGIEYDLPQAEFFFEADDGFFSIENGYTMDNYIYTTYFDSTREDKIYCTVDNETLSLDILNYDRKTEVLLETIDIPIGYQVNLIAKVHSCADYYYNNKVVDNGYVTFYIYNDEAEDYETIGHADVKKGKATLPIYFSSQKYSYGVKMLLAKYTPGEYYFSSEGSVEISLINPDNACYVSPTGENGDGTFYNPVSSIAQAIALHKQIIYLLEGYYKDVVEVNENIHIKKYFGDVIFAQHEDPIFINGNDDERYDIELDGLIFENNNQPIAQNFNNIIIKHCIFQNNTSSRLFEMNNMVNIESSVLIGNSNIVYPIIYEENGVSRPSYEINYCWYGCNLKDAEDIGAVTGLNMPDTSIVMNVETSKDIIYVGSVAKVIASLNKYVYSNDNEEREYDFTDTLPTREAFFSTDIGSIMPAKDNTYNNQAVAFLNTMDEYQKQDMFITFPDNTNYLYQNVKLQCYVQDIYGQNQDGIEINFEVRNSKNEVVNKAVGITVDGCATVSMAALPRDTYTLICKTSTIQVMDNFTIVPAYINVDQCNIDDGDHLYSLNVTLQCTNPLNTKINQQMVDFYIDDVYVDHGLIINGILSKELHYANIKQGIHTLKVTTKGYESDFQELNYEKEFTSTKKDTYVMFNDKSIAPNESTDLVFYIYDNENKPVTTGYIDIKFNYQTDNYAIDLQNGIGVLYDFVCDDIGQHTITVHYSGDTDYYNECLLNKTINVDIEEVLMSPKVEPITANIGSPLKFDMNIVDQSNRKLKNGHISAYLNDMPFTDENNETIYVDIKNGEASFNADLPIGIQAGNSYALKIIYQDINEPKRYADTSYLQTINIGAIPTQIFINTVYGSPGLTKEIDYNIQSAQNTINSGILTAYYNDQQIGSTPVFSADGRITLNIPKVAIDEVDTIYFKYTDENSEFSNSELSVPLVLDKIPIEISVSHTSYYPKQNLNLIAYCKYLDQALLSGELTLYVDNVKHSTRPIVNGEAIFSLKFNTIKEYQLTFIYEEDTYYARTLKEQTFNVSNIPIEEIRIVGNNLIAQPNSLHEIELEFSTANNLDVDDGYVDIYFNNKKINTYAIVQGKKYMSLKIPNLPSNQSYPLKIEYYDSKIFNNHTQEYECTLTYVPFEIEVDPVVAQANDEIVIHSRFTNNTSLTGILEYYLEADNGSKRLVDIASIKNATEYDHSYVLPTDLNGDEEYIVVKYMGDDQHTQQIGRATLTIEKTDIVIDDYSDIPNEVQYQHNLSFMLNTGLTTIHDFYIKLDDTILGIVQNTRDGMLTFNQRLPSNVGVGSYQLHIQSPATATFNEYHETQNINIIVVPTDPIFEDLQTTWEKYIGSEVVVPHQMKDYDGINIDGTFSYTIRNGRTLTPINNKVILSETQNTYIDIHWETNDDNFVSSDYSIEVIMKKNDIVADIDVGYETIYRGQKDIPLNITLNSSTTTDTRFPPYKVYVEDQEVAYNGSTFDMPLSLSNKDQYTLHVRYQATEQVYSNIFNEFDAQLILQNKNVNEIVVTIGEENATQVSTLTQALNLIGDYGIIYINKDIADEQCTNTKNVTITGNERTFTNCSIDNQGVLSIDDVTFNRTQSNDKYSAIINNNILHVQNCTFMNQKAQYGGAIYIDSKNKNTTITNCVFNGNEASVYGGAIFSNKGNDVNIQFCTFGESNYAEQHGSSISINGNMYIKDNIFYGNIGNEDIFIISGTLEAENNFFESNIKTINNASANAVTANLNYWGYNSIEDIENTWTGKVNIDNWMISDYEIHWTEPVLGQPQKHIIGRVNKYRARSQDDVAEITQYGNINGKMKLDNTYFDLNVEQITNINTLLIGQEEFDLGLNNDG